MLPVRIYISCNQLPKTRDSLDHILEKLSRSALDKSQIIIVHSADWDFEFTNFGLAIEFCNTGLTADHYEFPALSKIKADSQLQDFFGLYLHCKGSRKTQADEWQNSLAWIDYMCYGVIEHSQLCLLHLQQGADLVGSQWHWHFKGNFYWFRSVYVQQLVEPMLMDLDYRFNCEFWCAYSLWWGRYPMPRVKNLYYLQDLHTDYHYAILNQQHYVPAINKKHVLTGGFCEFCQQGKAEVFDVICVNQQEFNQCCVLISRYLNYDGVVINTETGQVYEANYFFH